MLFIYFCNNRANGNLISLTSPWEAQRGLRPLLKSCASFDITLSDSNRGLNVFTALDSDPKGWQRKDDKTDRICGFAWAIQSSSSPPSYICKCLSWRPPKWKSMTRPNQVVREINPRRQCHSRHFYTKMQAAKLFRILQPLQALSTSNRLTHFHPNPSQKSDQFSTCGMKKFKRYKILPNRNQHKTTI